MSKKSRPQKDWREERRMRAWELHKQGWTQQEIARAFGVTQGAVSQWLKKAKEQGVQALKPKPRPGAKSKLSKEQLAQLPALLKQGAEAFGFRGQVWTRHSGGSHDPATVWGELSSSPLQPLASQPQVESTKTCSEGHA